MQISLTGLKRGNKILTKFNIMKKKIFTRFHLEEMIQVVHRKDQEEIERVEVNQMTLKMNKCIILLQLKEESKKIQDIEITVNLKKQSFKIITLINKTLKTYNLQAKHHKLIEEVWLIDTIILMRKGNLILCLREFLTVQEKRLTIETLLKETLFKHWILPIGKITTSHQ